MDVILIIFAVIFFGAFLIRPIVETFFDDKLEYEEEKKKYLLDLYTEDTVKAQMREQFKKDDSSLKTIYVERPIKKTGKWDVYALIVGWDRDETHIKLFEIKDSELTKIIKHTIKK